MIFPMGFYTTSNRERFSDMGKILIIDDEPEMCDMLKLALENEGHEVYATVDGEEAVAHYCEEPSDLIITDIFMPSKDGIEIILDLQGRFSDLKIIVISGGGALGVGTEDVFVAAKEFGAHYTFKKPFKIEDMIKAVGDLLN